MSWEIEWRTIESSVYPEKYRTFVAGRFVRRRSATTRPAPASRTTPARRRHWRGRTRRPAQRPWFRWSACRRAAWHLARWRRGSGGPVPSGPGQRERSLHRNPGRRRAGHRHQSHGAASRTSFSASTLGASSCFLLNACHEQHPRVSVPHGRCALADPPDRAVRAHDAVFLLVLAPHGSCPGHASNSHAMSSPLQPA
jgi:hypothetical protein